MITHNGGLPTKYRRIRKDEPLYIVGDFGNTDVKAMMHGNFGEEIVFPHAVRKPTLTDYNNLAQKYKHRSAQLEGTAIFQIGRQGYVVGEHATQVGRGERLTGVDKYRRDHMGALLVAALLQLYPEGHDDVRLVVLHPADVNVDNMKALYKSVKGQHKAKVADGRDVSYNVREVIPIEEPVAGFQTFILNIQGRTYRTPRLHIAPNKRYLVCDVGGWITSFVPVLITRRGSVEVNVSGAPVIQRGIQDVIEVFEGEVKDAFPELAKVQDIPFLLMHNALLNDHINIKGKPHNCAQQVENAMQIIADRIAADYATKFANGTGYDGIIVTGGGGGLAFNYLDENVFAHPNVFTAEEDLDRMRFSNIRGASKGLINFLASNSK